MMTRVVTKYSREPFGFAPPTRKLTGMRPTFCMFVKQAGSDSSSQKPLLSRPAIAEIIVGFFTSEVLEMRLVKKEAAPWSSHQEVDRVANTRVQRHEQGLPSSIPSRLRLPVFPHRLPQIKAHFAPRENRGVSFPYRSRGRRRKHATVIFRHKTIADSMHGAEVSRAAFIRFQLLP